MRKRIILVFLALLFAFGQFLSIAQATDVMQSIAAQDNIDDISLEDVVPVDPFVGVSKPHAVQEATLACAIRLITAILNWLPNPDDTNSFSSLTLERGHPLPPKLSRRWLTLQRLLT